MKSKEEALLILLENAFRVHLNLNDTFAWGCADCEEIEIEDAEDIIKYIQKYGYYAIVAYVSVKRELLNEENINPLLMNDTYKKYFGDNILVDRDNYIKSRDEIIKAIKEFKEFPSVSFDYNQKQQDEKEFGEKVRWKSVALEGQSCYTQIAYLAKKGISASGFNMKQARDNLKLIYMKEIEK